MKKYGRILLVGWVSLVIANRGLGAEEEWVRNAIENLSQHFAIRRDLNPDVKYCLLNQENREKYMAPLCWGYFYQKNYYHINQINYIGFSYKILKLLAQYCEMESLGTLKDTNLDYLKKHYEIWQKLYNTSVNGTFGLSIPLEGTENLEQNSLQPRQDVLSRRTLQDIFDQYKLESQTEEVSKAKQWAILHAAGNK